MGYHDMLGRAVRSRRGVERRRQNSGRETHAPMTQAKRRRVVRKRVKDTKAGYPWPRPSSGIVKEGRTLRHDEYGNTIVEYPDGRREVIVGHPKPMEVVTDLKSWLGGGLESRRLGISLHGTLEKAISLKESILGNMSKRRRRWW